MLTLFRKWGIALKRRRLSKERDRLRQYVAVEQDVRGAGNRCYNCNAPLTGPFCHICGQRDDDLRRPIWTFFRELFDAIFDTDSKIIKTILMLIAVPGGLSRDFLEGKRARYLPPFRLYIVLLFVFFSTLSLADILIIDIHVTPKAETVAAREAFEAEIAEAERMRERAEEIREQLREQGLVSGAAEGIPDIPQIEGAPDPDAVREQVRQALAEVEQEVEVVAARAQVSRLVELIERVGAEIDDDAEEEAFEGFIEAFADELEAMEESGQPVDLETARERGLALADAPDNGLSIRSRTAIKALLGLDAGALTESAIVTTDEGTTINFDELPYDFDIDMFVSYDRVEREGIKQEDIDFILENPEYPDIVKNATIGFMEALRSPREFNELFNDWLPWALVVLMPVFALILSVTHWGKRRYYLNQLVFSLHFHSFLFVLLTVFAFIVPIVGGEDAFAIFWWGTSLYLIIALKVGQKQGWVRAFLKAGFIWVSYFIIMMWTMAAVMFFGISNSTVGEFWDLVTSAGTEVVVDDGAQAPTDPASVIPPPGTEAAPDAAPEDGSETGSEADPEDGSGA